MNDPEDSRNIKNVAFEPGSGDDVRSESGNPYEVFKEPTYASLDSSKRDPNDDNVYQSLNKVSLEKGTGAGRDGDTPFEESEYAALNLSERNSDDESQYQSLMKKGHKKKSEEDEVKDDYEDIVREAGTNPNSCFEKPEYAELNLSKRDLNDESQYQSLENEGLKKKSEEDEVKDDYEEVVRKAGSNPDTCFEKPEYEELNLSK